MNVTSTLQPDPAAPAPGPRLSLAEVDASCRAAVLFLFFCAAIWLVVGWAFAMVASLKFHAPGLLADNPWSTYGRVYPAFLNAWIYGFAIQAGLGVLLWMLARLGRARLAQRGLIILGALFWNVGVAAGFLGILGGAGTGYEFFEFPRFAIPFLFIGYLLMGVFGVVTFYRRTERALYVSQWFLLAALFWFPWIHATASCLLVFEPVRGAAQIPVHLWYVNNLFGIFLTFIGLAVVLYFVPKLTGRELPSRWLLLFMFWVLLLFGSWGGIHPGVPLPAWLPAMSTATTVISLTAVLALFLVYWELVRGQRAKMRNSVPLRFIGFGAAAYFVAAAAGALTSLKSVSAATEFTLFRFAQTHLELYAFVSMVLFGAIYHIAPRLAQCEWPCSKLTATHFWCSAIGAVVLILSMGVGGMVHGGRINDPSVPFVDIMRAIMMFIRTGTLAELLILAGHVAFLGNVLFLLNRCCRTCCLPAIGSLTNEAQAAEVKR